MSRAAHPKWSVTITLTYDLSAPDAATAKERALEVAEAYECRLFCEAFRSQRGKKDRKNLRIPGRPLLADVALGEVKR